MVLTYLHFRILEWPSIITWPFFQCFEVPKSTSKDGWLVLGRADDIRTIWEIPIDPRVLPSTFLQCLHLPSHLQAQRGAEGMPRQVEGSRGNNLANLARSSCAKMYGIYWLKYLEMYRNWIEISQNIYEIESHWRYMVECHWNTISSYSVWNAGELLNIGRAKGPMKPLADFSEFNPKKAHGTRWSIPKTPATIGRKLVCKELYRCRTAYFLTDIYLVAILKPSNTRPAEVRLFQDETGQLSERSRPPAGWIHINQLLRIQRSLLHFMTLRI
jgi:hypothetical protein